MFRALASKNFPPFGKFQIEFPVVENKPAELAEVHLFTGVNGTGKTRLLAVLAAMLGNPAPLHKRVKGVTQNIEIAGRDKTPPPPNPPQTWPAIFASGQNFGWMRSGPFTQWCQTVPAFAYNGTAYLSDANVTVMAGLPKPDRAACLSFSRPEGYSQRLLQGITNLKVQAAMDVMNAGASVKTTRSTQIVRALEATVSEITGHPFVFHVKSFPQPTLCVKWANTELPFDLLPDGLRSIIGWLVDAVVALEAWLQGQGDLSGTEAVFLLDEVESHLHPVWQRRILPAFQRLFPKAQIFVATHSPFVISSLNHGWIHKLTLENDGHVKVVKPEPASLGDSYIYVLEEIMGLPQWYDPETEELLAKFRGLRDEAFGGSDDAKAKAFELGRQLACRSDELRYVMGKELNQMERRLGKAEAK